MINFDLKLGCKILCKKTNKAHDNDIGVDENVWYEIVKIDVVPIVLDGMDIMRFIQVNDGKSIFNIHFCITERNNKSDYIWDYFYTTKELRKKKTR